MKHRIVVVLIGMLAVGCGGDDTGGGGSGDPTQVDEQEPNDERAQATQLPAGGGTFVIHGHCFDATDLDYYEANPSATGPYTATLTWTAGAFELAFDPEDGFSGDLTSSMTSPITVTGSITATSPAPQFAVDCYNDPDPGGVFGLAYTLELTL